MIMTFKKLSDEMNRLLDWLQTSKTDKESLYCWYYLFMFWTGLRWNDVSDNTLYIHRSIVRGREKSVTKTHVARLVYLNKHSQLAIDNLRDYHRDYDKVYCPIIGSNIYTLKDNENHQMLETLYGKSFDKPNLKPNKDIGYMLCIYSMAY